MVSISDKIAAVDMQLREVPVWGDRPPTHVSEEQSRHGKRPFNRRGLSLWVPQPLGLSRDDSDPEPSEDLIVPRERENICHVLGCTVVVTATSGPRSIDSKGTDRGTCWWPPGFCASPDIVDETQSYERFDAVPDPIERDSSPDASRQASPQARLYQPRPQLCQDPVPLPGPVELPRPPLCVFAEVGLVETGSFVWSNSLPGVHAARHVNELDGLQKGECARESYSSSFFPEDTSNSSNTSTWSPRHWFEISASAVDEADDRELNQCAKDAGGFDDEGHRVASTTSTCSTAHKNGMGSAPSTAQSCDTKSSTTSSVPSGAQQASPPYTSETRYALPVGDRVNFLSPRSLCRSFRPPPRSLPEPRQSFVPPLKTIGEWCQGQVGAHPFHSRTK